MNDKARQISPVLSVAKKIFALSLVAGVGILAGCQTPAMKLRNEGLRLYHQQKYAAALTKFNESLKYNESQPRGNYYAGAADYMLGRYEQSQYHYKMAWRVDPNYGHVKSALAEALIKSGKPNEAMNFLERDAALTQRPAGRLRVARFYEKLGDLDDARANYIRAAQMAPTDASMQMAAAQFFDRIGQKAAAGKYYARAYKLNPALPGLVAAMMHDGLTISDAYGPPATHP